MRTVVSSEYVLVPPMESRDVSVECNPDKVVTGGALLLFDGNKEGNPSILEAGLPVNQPPSGLSIIIIRVQTMSLSGPVQNA